MSRTLLATAGDRLALERVFWEAKDGAAFEAETLSLWEVDAEGRIVAAISFDPDDRRAAAAEMLARDPHPDAIKRAMSDHDLDRLRAELPDDFVLNDHRRTGLGQLGERRLHRLTGRAVRAVAGRDHRARSTPSPRKSTAIS